MNTLRAAMRSESDPELNMRKSKFDAIELEILWKRLISVVDEASATFVRTCFSTLVRDGNDFAVVLTDAQGRSLAQSTMSIPSFIGCLPATVKHFLEKFPAETLKPGDVLVTNDPWMGSGHIHDVNTAMPIFHKGTLVAFAAVVSHLPDIGGRLRSNSSREIYEEGLQIPRLKLMEAGEPNATLVEMISQNVRVPEQGMGDIWAQVSACKMMSDRLQTLLDTVNLDDLGEEVRIRSENAMREAIRQIPDGVYRSQVEHDGFDERIAIHCKLTVQGDRIDIDYTGSSLQQPRAVNVVPIYTFAYSAYPLKALLCPDIPNNEGSFLPITTHAPLGTIFNPTYPAASGGRGAIGHLLPAAVFMALADVLPNNVWASGSANSSVTMSGEKQGTRFAVVNFLNAGQGATAQRDGYSAVSFPANLGNTPVEMMETLAPIRVLKRAIRRCSGGRGKHNGGDGISFEFVITPEATSLITASFLMTRLKSPPPGLFGGKAGQPGRLVLNGQQIDPTEPRILKPGDHILMETAGGGGFGTP
jgi:N-methylhydantoinase B